MEKFEVNILGCGSALPTSRHNPTSQVVNLREKLFMIDCGEGTQQQFRKSKLKFSRLNRIFISHLHGDHCFGLIGLISTLNLLGRTAQLHIYSPQGLQELLSPMLAFFCKEISFEVIFHSFQTKQAALIYEDRSITVHTIPLIHRIPCCGFLFAEKPRPNHIIREMIDFYQIPTYEINKIKNGADFTTPDGEVIPNSRLTTPSERPRSYAYCSDTLYNPNITEQIKGVNVLFHEATFAQNELKRAQETYHSTATQAAQIALSAQAGKLIIGHYSARYDNEKELEQEAKSVFEQTIIAQENMQIEIS